MPRQTKHGVFLADTEYSRPSPPKPHRIEKEVCARGLKHALKEGILHHRDVTAEQLTPFSDYTLESHDVVFAASVFNHHHGISTFRNSGAGHDLQASSGSEYVPHRVTGLNFSHALQLRVRHRFTRTNRVTIARRAVKGRILTVGFHLLR